jgi:hypothetical protein
MNVVFRMEEIPWAVIDLESSFYVYAFMDLMCAEGVGCKFILAEGNTWIWREKMFIVIPFYGEIDLQINDGGIPESDRQIQFSARYL